MLVCLMPICECLPPLFLSIFGGMLVCLMPIFECLPLFLPAFVSYFLFRVIFKGIRWVHGKRVKKFLRKCNCFFRLLLEFVLYALLFSVLILGNICFLTGYFLNSDILRGPVCTYLLAPARRCVAFVFFYRRPECLLFLWVVYAAWVSACMAGRVLWVHGVGFCFNFLIFFDIL